MCVRAQHLKMVYSRTRLYAHGREPGKVCAYMRDIVHFMQSGTRINVHLSGVFAYMRGRLYRVNAIMIHTHLTFRNSVVIRP